MTALRDLQSQVFEALAGCIAVRNEGFNHHADCYFIRMIGANAEPEKEPADARALRNEETV